MSDIKTTLYSADSRGSANHGWLKARFSFSFAEYYNPARMGFGALRVLNNDIIAPGAGFPTHSHKDMEIITIPLRGSIAHKDSMGTDGVVTTGEIQVMSAGTGVEHSEYNASKTDELELLQLWITPHSLSVAPRYQQISYNQAERNKWSEIVSPNLETPSAWIHQNAWLYIGTFDAGSEPTYRLHDTENGLFVFVINGMCTILSTDLLPRDALEIKGADRITIKDITANTKILLVEIPMD